MKSQEMPNFVTMTSLDLKILTTGHHICTVDFLCGPTNSLNFVFSALTAAEIAGWALFTPPPFSRGRNSQEPFPKAY